MSTSTAALRCFRLRVCVSSASSVSSLISNEVTSNDDCLDLPPSSLPNLAILERSLSPLPACSSQPAFERSREKGHAMLSSMRIPLLEGIEDMNSSDNSLQLCHTVDKDRSIGWHQVNKRTQRSRYAALSCLSAISCAVDTVSALPSSSFRRVSSSATICQSFNLQRSPRGFFLSVLSGPRVGQSTRIIALRARARSDTCRDHRPPSCTLGQRSTTLSFHLFSKRNPPIIPHVICPTLTATKSCTWNNTNRRCSNDQ